MNMNPFPPEFFPPWTWVNIFITAYYTLTLPLVFLGQTKAEEGAVVWSKFAIDKKPKYPVSAKCGMLMKYIPAMLFVAIWIASGSGAGLMEILVSVHFGKRILEVSFLHSFIGSPIEDGTSSFFIGLFYTLMSWLYIRQGAQAVGLLQTVAIVFFVLGMLGNLYHHLLLRRLRAQVDESNSSDGRAGLLSKESSPPTSQTSGLENYKIPHGGLFELTTCPHYFCEVVEFWGMALAAFNVNAFLCAASTTSMLAGHSLSTTAWYVSKFGDAYPKTRKHMIPFIF